MTTVWIPQVLRANVGGVKTVDVEGSTVGEVVRALVDRHPALTTQLLTEDGDLNRFVNVYVDGQDVRYLQGLDTPVGATGDVRILPAMAGG
jgi:molybdopterin converting factor small subunit